LVRISSGAATLLLGVGPNTWPEHDRGIPNSASLKNDVRAGQATGSPETGKLEIVESKGFALRDAGEPLGHCDPSTVSGYQSPLDRGGVDELQRLNFDGFAKAFRQT
jgi:hypothetical protein